MKKLARDCIYRIEIYKPGKSFEDLKQGLSIEGEIAKLASNENPLGPSPLALGAIQESVKDGNLYPDTDCHDLKQTIGEYLQVSPEKLCVGNGTTELILLLGLAFLNPCDTFIMSRSSFIMAKMVAHMMDSRLVEVPLKEYRHDLDSILQAVTEDTKIIYMDNPMNPIGSFVSQQEFSKFMSEVPEDIVIVMDEAYHEYVDHEDYPDCLNYIKDGKNLIVLRTFSKMYGMAGFRVGYCVAKEEFVDAINRVRPPFNVNRPGQIGAAAALKDHEHIEKTRELTQEGKRFLYESFEKMGVFYIPSETNFVTVDAKTNAADVCGELQKKGVIVRPLTMYGKPTFLRVTIGKPEQNKRFVDAFRQIYQNDE